MINMTLAKDFRIYTKVDEVLKGKEGKDFEPLEPGPLALELQAKIRHAMINVETYQVFRETLVEMCAYTLATLQKYDEANAEFEKDRAAAC